MSICSDAFQDLQNDTDKFSKAIDAYGKVPAGIFSGNFQWLGDYDTCVSIPGLKYCSIGMLVKTDSSANQTSPPIQLTYGTCVPDVCTSDDIIAGFNNVTSNPALPFTLKLRNVPFGYGPVNCQEFPQRPYDAGFVCFTIFCSLLLLLVILGTALDIFQKYKRKQLAHSDRYAVHTLYGSLAEGKERSSSVDDSEHKPLIEDTSGTQQNNGMDTSDTEILEIKSESNPGLFQEILLCFAFNRNLTKLLDTSGSDRSIRCLNGMRVISLMWVILGHTFVILLMAYPENILSVFDNITDFSFQAICNAYSAVDTFFFMSGFLLAFLIFSRMEKSGLNISWLQFYVHRIWRLTPQYAFVILFSIYFHPLFGYGPMWYVAEYFDDLCEKYWWRNLLYINNFYPSTEQCMLWSWYMPNDMQFYVISPLIIIPLYKSRVFGMLWISIMTAVSLVTTSALIAYNDLDASPYGTIFGLGTQGTGIGGSGKHFIEVIYYKPYCRISPYLLGIAVGYLVNKQIQEHKRVRLSKLTVVLGWTLSTAIGLATIYGTYSSYGERLFQSVWSKTENVFYGAFSRLGWSVSLSWLLFACHYGYGGWINSFLSWSFWTPLSRLTYSAYLIHGFVVFTYFLGYPTAYHASNMSTSYIFCGSLLLSYAAGGVISLLIEYPCAGLEKLLLRSRKSGPKTTKNIE